MKSTLRYAVTDLDTLGGQNSYGQDINNKGWVVGSADPGVGYSHAFLWTGRKMEDLGALGSDYPGSYATCINENGWVAGHVTTGRATGLTRAVLWRGGKITDLGALPGDQYSSADGINDKGQIVGVSVKIAGTIEFMPRPDQMTMRLFVWHNGRMTPLRHGNETMVNAMDINNAGTVIGVAGMGDQPVFVLERGGRRVSLGTLGGKYSYAAYIGDDGTVVGQAATATGELRAFLYRQGKMTDLGTLGGNSNAGGINAAGTVVGSFEGKPGDFRSTRAFVYDAGKMTDLNNLVPANLEWRLTSANAINDRGQIICHGQKDKVTHALLLTPKA